MSARRIPIKMLLSDGKSVRAGIQEDLWSGLIYHCRAAAAEPHTIMMTPKNFGLFCLDRPELLHWVSVIRRNGDVATGIRVWWDLDKQVVVLPGPRL